MVTRILEALAGFVIFVISSLGLPGIVLLMAIESACIPLPSEVIMPFSGYLVYKGVHTLWEVSLAGAFGCVVGSIPAYYLGMYGGRPLIEKYGKYILMSRHDLDLADRWFTRHGEATVFFARLLPVIRTFIAFPAGVARMDMKRFLALHLRRVVPVVPRAGVPRDGAGGKMADPAGIFPPVRPADRRGPRGGGRLVRPPAPQAAASAE